MPEDQSAWHREVLPDGWICAVNELTARSALEGFYDLFHKSEFDPGELLARMSGLSDLRVRQIVRGTLHLDLHEILVSFLHYPYPLLFAPRPIETFAVADARDIACMKVEAIASRGSRRDFVDLYVAARAYGLGNILAWFDEKYAGTPYNRVHLLKALTYFADAEQQPMPHMLVPLAWDTITRFFLAEVPRLQRSL